MDITPSTPSVKNRAMLAVLQQAIAKTLDKKQRLGQYAVVWADGRPLLTGPDAPILTPHEALRSPKSAG